MAQYTVIRNNISVLQIYYFYTERYLFDFNNASLCFSCYWQYSLFSWAIDLIETLRHTQDLLLIKFDSTDSAG
jgi:hypothetical protein